MANECTLMVETELPVMFKCADGTGIPKGTVLELTESMTVVAVSGTTKMIAGIAAAEKIASDGNVMIPVYMGGIFKGVAKAAILIGAPLMSGATDLGRLTTQTTSTGATGLGYALEAPNADAQTFLFRLQIGNSTS